MFSKLNSRRITTLYSNPLRRVAHKGSSISLNFGARWLLY